ncbi:MAG: sulfur carrier protein ThiS [Thiotrichales bacterium]|nr:sulfur carrier protein ThiS [Thiotrichales bacterium]
MQIMLNGDPHIVADGATIASLVEQLDLAGKRLAVEVNEEVVPRSRHGEHALESGDQVEIVHAIGGG